ncbi:hypothetical protein HYT59_00010 [Candidatus Woesebacteria bacterium]|nr:hypothetical protein [Candidatus Woesebacteria bacterium]
MFERLKKRLKLLPIILAAAVVGFGGWQVYKNVAVSDSEIVKSAIEAFGSASTVHADMEITIDVPEKDDLPATSTKITAASDIGLVDNSQNTHMTFGLSGVTAEIEMISIKADELYLKMPFLYPDWLQLDAETLAQETGLPLDPKYNDYAAQTKGYLKSLDLSSLKKVGEELIDEKRVIHYKVNLNKDSFENYLKELSGDEKLIEGFKNSQMEADLWINRKENQVVQMEIKVRDFDVNEPLTNESLGKANMTIKVKYSKYNQTLDIKRPEGEIISYEDLQNEKLPFIPEAR